MATGIEALGCRIVVDVAPVPQAAMMVAGIEMAQTTIFTRMQSLNEGFCW